MASSTSRAAPHGTSTNAPTSAGRTYFEQERERLLGEIGVSFEHVLANINKLNRSLEGVIAVGNEFSSVEALWSQFENVMAKEEVGAEAEEDERQDNDGDEHGDAEEGPDGGDDGKTRRG